MGNELQVSESQQLQVQVDVANKYPRNLVTFVDDVFNVVVRDQDFAMSCIYCVPVGQAQDKSQTFAMGPSVRLSEEMQKYWKHLRIVVNCEEQSDKIIVQGLVMDCQANNVETLTSTSSTKDSSGRAWSDRRKELKLKAMQSCMKRDLRISIMGKSYADELIQKIIDEILTDKVQVWEYCKTKYYEIGVPENTVLKYFKAGSADELTRKQIYQAIGMYNFLKDNGKEPDYLFGSMSDKPASRPQVTPDMVKVEPLQEQPANASQKKPASNAKKAAAPTQNQKPSEVMDDSEFVKTAMPLIIKMGYDENSISSVLEAELSITGGIHNVPADMQSGVIDFLTTMARV